MKPIIPPKKSALPRDPEPQWIYLTRLAVGAFFAGACCSYNYFESGSLIPFMTGDLDSGGCGLSGVACVVGKFIGVPLFAVVSLIGGGFIGAALDFVLHRRRQFRD